jgi:phosphate transport system substrate-binding protein
LEGNLVKRALIKYLVVFMVISMITGSASCMEINVSGTNGKAPVEGELMLTGSTSMSDVTNALAEAYMKKFGDVIVSVGGNGSGEGPTSVKDGAAQIGLLSRELKDSENPELFDQYIIGLDGVAVIVNPDSFVKELTLLQLADIFSGKTSNWKELGGPDAPIQCIGREAASGTRGAFEEIIGIPESAVYAEEQNSTGNVKQAVAGNPNAIGYVSVSSLDKSVVAVMVDGIAPSDETVASGTYKIQRPFLMITQKGTEDELTKSFLDFIFSDEGRKIIEEDGIIPVDKV